MLVSLPVLTFILLFGYFYLEQNAPESNWRAAFLEASVASGVYQVLLLEILSLWGAVDQAFVAAAWAIPILILPPILLKKDWRRLAHLVDFRQIHFSLTTFFVAALLMVTSILAIISFFAPPSTWDSLVYHMARVVFWMDHRSVAYYATNTLRQLYQPPFAEYGILNLQVLSGTDRFANFVQWFSMVGSLVGVSLIAKRLGAGRHGQILASVLAATIPMGILQSTSTQNDYVVGFNLICFVYFLLDARETIGGRSLFFAGAALGLAILTKATAYIYAAPFLGVACLFIILKLKFKSFKPLFIIAALVILVNLGQFARNIDLFGNPIGPLSASAVGEVEYANAIHTPRALISNVILNIAIHLGTSNDRINWFTDTIIHKLHDAIQFNVGDPRITYGTNTFSIHKISFNEDYDGNLAHIILIALTCAALLFSKRLRKVNSLIVYGLALIAGFILFCFYLRWQPWHSRLHLPWFLLWCPLVAVVFAEIFRQRWLPTFIFGCALIILSYPWMVNNSHKHLTGPESVLTRDRMEQYFVNLPDYQKDYGAAVDIASQDSCSEIGLYLPGGWEYPAWVYLRNRTASPLRLRDVLVSNISSKYSKTSDFTPCAIIANNTLDGNEIVVDQHNYQKIWESSSLNIWQIY